MGRLLSNIATLNATGSKVHSRSVIGTGEYGASASDVIAETIWLQPEVANDNPLGGDDGISGYAPLAVAAGSGANAALHWVHGNHLGVPLVTTDSSGAMVIPTGYTLPGFPGQMRTLADLYYNRHRDYDSSTGRYIQADPIGLDGGDNSYLYADGNPLRYVDPEGLAHFEIRPLDGWPYLGGASNNAIDNSLNTSVAHEHLFFDNGGCSINGRFYRDVGFFADSTLKSDPVRQSHRRIPGNYDDELMCQAVNNVKLKPYRLFGNNCQSWADEVRDEYYRLLRQRNRRRTRRR